LRTAYTDAAKGKAVVKLFEWLVSSSGQAEGSPLDYAPLPAPVQALATSNLKLVKAGGAAVLS
ncbi:MAG TPA: phosphate ABC transporter substrate-binding protein PstS, partial [Methylomirabilota bacterium]